MGFHRLAVRRSGGGARGVKIERWSPQPGRRESIDTLPTVALAAAVGCSSMDAFEASERERDAQVPGGAFPYHPKHPSPTVPQSWVEFTTIGTTAASSIPVFTATVFIDDGFGSLFFRVWSPQEARPAADGSHEGRHQRLSHVSDILCWGRPLEKGGKNTTVEKRR